MYKYRRYLYTFLNVIAVNNTQINRLIEHVKTILNLLTLGWPCDDVSSSHLPRDNSPRKSSLEKSEI